MADKIEWHPNGTPGPWWVCEYDAGDTAHYDSNGPCPSIQAPDSEDCAVVHWDGFKQRYWSACNGDQRQIETNARAIVEAPAMVQALREDVAEYDRLNPMRTADMHRTDCRCERCRIDEKRAILARIDKEANNAPL